MVAVGEVVSSSSVGRIDGILNVGRRPSCVVGVGDDSAVVLSSSSFSFSSSSSSLPEPRPKPSPMPSNRPRCVVVAVGDGADDGLSSSPDPSKPSPTPSSRPRCVGVVVGEAEGELSPSPDPRFKTKPSPIPSSRPAIVDEMRNFYQKPRLLE